MKYRMSVTTIRPDARAKQFMKLTGIGDTNGTALIAMIGNACDSKCGRQLRAGLGLVPGRSSSREEITARASCSCMSVRARV
jgi:transposase